MGAKPIYIISGLSIIIASLIHTKGMYELSFWLVTIASILAVYNRKEIRNKFIRILWVLIMVIIVLLYNPLLGYEEMYALFASALYSDWNIVVGVLLIIRSLNKLAKSKPDDIIPVCETQTNTEST